MDDAALIGQMAAAALIVIEHATEYAGGSMLVWNEAEHVTDIFPTDEKIRLERRHGKVWARKVIVVEDWSEVPNG